MKQKIYDWIFDNHIHRYFSRAYTGSPIGTTYTVSVFPTENVEERVLPNKSSMINMVIWVTESFPKIVDVRPIIVLRKVNRLFNGEIKLQVQGHSIVYILEGGGIKLQIQGQ